MNFRDVIIRNRRDMRKVFLFFPHTGISLEADCGDPAIVRELLERMKHESVRDVERECHAERIPDETLEDVRAIYKDLKSMDISFDDE